MGEKEAKKDIKAAATPSQVRDAMLIPNTAVKTKVDFKTSYSVLQQNWIFAQQWKKADTAGRDLVEMKVGGNDTDFLAAITAAAKNATGHDVILASGHGGAGDFRGLSETVFDSVPNATHGLEHHPFAITRSVLELPDIAEKKDGKWVPKSITLPGGTKATESQGTVDALVPRYEMMVKAGDLLRANGVSRFILLACNVGKDNPAQGHKPFLELLAKTLGVEAVGYTGLVAVAEQHFDGKVEPPDETLEQIWIATDETNPSANRPPLNDRTHASFHEVPTDHRISAKP